jgi:cytochrome c oxidase cbb3-type subunit I/II
MTYNLIKTAYAGNFIANEDAEAAPLVKEYVQRKGGWHNRVLEHKPVLFTVLTLVAILAGGIIEMIPTFLIKSNIPTISSVKPYSPLELHGRDIYIREG